MTNTAKLALARIVLGDEPATPGVMHALTLIESAMPRSGTPEYRAAFAEAHATRKAQAA
jgi:hypothetical protein